MTLVDAVRTFLPHGLPLPAETWAKRHRALLTLLWFHVPALIVLGIATGHEPLHVVLKSLIPTAAAVVAGRTRHGRGLPMVATTFGLLTCSLIFVDFSGRDLGMQFHYFLIVAAVAFYQRWLPFLFALAYVLGQHALLVVLDAAGLYPHPAGVADPWRWAVVHYSFLLGQGIIVLRAWPLNEDSRSEMERSYARLLEEEEAKLEAQERYREVFDNSLEGLYESNAAGELLIANPQTARILGWESPEELLRTRISDYFVDPADRDRCMALLREHGSVSGFRFRARRRDGAIRWLSNHATAVCDENGEIITMQGALEDVTAEVEADEERRELESQLRQAQKMEAVGELAGGIAHEFNNLLSVIQNYTDFALEGLESSEQRHQDLQEVKKAGSKATFLVQQLREFARKEHAPQLIAVDPNEAIVGFVKALGDTLDEGVRLEVDLEPSAWPILIGERQLDLILTALVTNARDAMPDGGRILLTTSSHEPGSIANEAALAPGTAYLRICVEDEGIGIPPEIRGRLFEPFFTTKGRQHGTGLELATVHGLVRQLGGHIDVTSEQGAGTCFSIYLPAAEVAPALPSDDPSGPDGQQAGNRILVVEDEAPLLSVVCRILARNGYDPVPAASPAEARALLEGSDGCFDLLLTDVIMPGGSGPELSLEALRLCPDMPVIFMSGYDDGMLADHSGIHQGVLLPKPFSADQLIEQTRAALLSSAP